MQMASASVARMRGLPEPRRSSIAKANFALWTEQSDATSLAYFHKYRHAGSPDGWQLCQRSCARAEGMRANINGILSMGYQPFYQFYEALALDRACPPRLTRPPPRS